MCNNIVNIMILLFLYIRLKPRQGKSYYYKKNIIFYIVKCMIRLKNYYVKIDIRI